MALLVPETSLGLQKKKKNIEFLYVGTVLGTVAQMLFKYKSRKLDTTPVYFVVLMDIVVSILME